MPRYLFHLNLYTQVCHALELKVCQERKADFHTKYTPTLVKGKLRTVFNCDKFYKMTPRQCLRKRRKNFLTVGRVGLILHIINDVSPNIPESHAGMSIHINSNAPPCIVYDFCHTSIQVLPFALPSYTYQQYKYPLISLPVVSLQEHIPLS